MFGVSCSFRVESKRLWILVPFCSVSACYRSVFLFCFGKVERVCARTKCLEKNKLATMFIIVPDIFKFHFSVDHKIFQIKSVIFLLCLNACLKFSVVIAGPSIQQEQELLLLEALSKRQPSYYGTSNSLMDILGRSTYNLLMRQLKRLTVLVQDKIESSECHSGLFAKLTS